MGKMLNKSTVEWGPTPTAHRLRTALVTRAFHTAANQTPHPARGANSRPNDVRNVQKLHESAGVPSASPNVIAM